MKDNTINFKRIFIFLVIAISLSNIFRFDIFGTKEILEILPTWIYLLSNSLPQRKVTISRNF